MATPFEKLTSQVMTQGIQTGLWLLRRYDYYINGSVASLGNPRYYDDPYPTYRTLRQRGSLLKSAMNRGWITFSYDVAKTVLADKRISSDIRHNDFLVNVVRYATSGIDEMPLIDNPTLLNLDAPDHTRLRKLVVQGFMHKYIQSLAPTIQHIVDSLLEDIPADMNGFDVIKTLARPLPAIVIAEMMGVPVADRHRFEAWSERLIGLTSLRDPSKIRAAAVANEEMRRYVAELAAEKRLAPGQDLISQLLAAEEDGDMLTMDELYSTCVVLLVAGHETTTRLIGNCLFQLLKHPDQLQAVQQNDELMGNAIEEALRYDSPVQLTMRFAKEPLEIAGQTIKRNQLIVVCIGGANHDPLVNPDPDVFNILRENI